MAIAGVQLVYRLKDFVRLLIDYRESPTPDTFNLYWSTTSGGAYTLFAEKILNQPSSIPQIRGKILFEFVPSQITNPTQWDNNQTNYIKLAPVTGGVVGAQEGPIEIPTKDEVKQPSDGMTMYGFNKDLQKFIAVSVDQDGKVFTV